MPVKTSSMRVLSHAVEMVPLDALLPHPRNPRQGDIGAIIESIQENGFFGALVVQRSTGHVLVGNHRFLAAAHLGVATVPVLYVDVDNERALKILLSDNRAADLAAYDTNALATLLTELAGEQARNLVGTGYTGDDLDELLKELGADVGFAHQSDTDASMATVNHGGVDTGQNKQIVLIYKAADFPLVRHRLNVVRKRLGLLKDGDVLATLLNDVAGDVFEDEGADASQKEASEV